MKINQSSQIAQSFNDHFATIGRKPASQINAENNKCLSYLSNRIPSSIVLIPPSPNEIYNTIHSLNTKKNNEELHSYFLKQGASVCSFYLAHMITNAFQSGIYISG